MKKLIVAASLAAAVVGGAGAQSKQPNWEWAGWGGGGYFYTCAFHPTRNGVIYMGGDVCGAYRSDDHGKSWRLINNGLVDYGVFSLAVHKNAPDTIYAATDGGLCKSIDSGASWKLLPNTEKGKLRITGEKGKSIRCIAIDPGDPKVLFAGSPKGVIYKSVDGGDSWTQVWAPGGDNEPAGTARIQYGKVNGAYFGGFWSPIEYPKTIPADKCKGFGFSFSPEGKAPQNSFLQLKAGDGTSWMSKNLNEYIEKKGWQDVLLTADDFKLQDEWVQKNPDKAAELKGKKIDFSTIVRFDMGCVGPLDESPVTLKVTKFVFVGGDGKPVVVRDFIKQKGAQSYGNVRFGGEQGSGAVLSVAVADKNRNLVLAAASGTGLLISRDGGNTWRVEESLPKTPKCIAISASDPNLCYVTFGKSGCYRSKDGGKSWTNLSDKFAASVDLYEPAINPMNPQEVYISGTERDWHGRMFTSKDGGESFQMHTQLKADYAANPTLPKDQQNGMTGISAPKNLAINPLNPQEIFSAANWRPVYSADGGKTWEERVKGADISCVYDIKFHKGKVYAVVMDEGTLVSEDNGKSWKGLWPLKHDWDMSGHNWNVEVAEYKGQTRIVSTCSPWDNGKPNRVIVSEDGGKSFSQNYHGLPSVRPTANTMWGIGYARSFAMDPTNPLNLYLGIDGDPSGNCPSGGGFFKSTDGGKTWTQPSNQPKARRAFKGLAIDPTNPKRLYWAGCASNGGIYKSEDAGETWELATRNEDWPFNVYVDAKGAVYCPGKNLWKSTDQGKTWKKLTNNPWNYGRVILAIAVDPTDTNRIWYTETTWDGSNNGAIFESTNGGSSWTEITSNAPYRKPMVLNYNPATKELWAAGVCIFKCKR